MRVLLIQPKTDAIGFTNLIMAEPLGLEMVAAALPAHQVRIVDLRLGNNLLAELTSFKPDVCGISCSYTIDFWACLKIARVVKDVVPDAFVVVGGHHASLCSSDFPPESIDAIVLGEGEETFRDLVQALQGKGSPDDVAGLVLNRKEGQVKTPPRAFARNLDSLPFPVRNGGEKACYHLGFQRPVALVETSRGCMYQCSFCGVWQFYRRTYRTKSPRRVLEELRRVREPFVLFVDDNFLADVDRAEELAKLIRACRIKKRYTFQARSDTIVKHPDVLKLWQEIGLGGVFIGFEEIRDEGLKELKKNNRVKNNDEALAILQDLGIDVWASFIVNPDYDRDDFRRLKDYILRRKIKTPTFSVLTPLPGTQLFEQLKEKLVTADYGLFDIAHAVLPTRLPLGEFYEEFCSLYKLPYSKYGLIREGIGAWILRGFKLAQLLDMLRSAKKLSTPRHYLKAHGSCIGR